MRHASRLQFRLMFAQRCNHLFPIHVRILPQAIGPSTTLYQLLSRAGKGVEEGLSFAVNSQISSPPTTTKSTGVTSTPSLPCSGVNSPAPEFRPPSLPPELHAKPPSPAPLTPPHPPNPHSPARSPATART